MPTDLYSVFDLLLVLGFIFSGYAGFSHGLKIIEMIRG